MRLINASNYYVAKMWLSQSTIWSRLYAYPFFNLYKLMFIFLFSLVIVFNIHTFLLLFYRRLSQGNSKAGNRRVSCSGKVNVNFWRALKIGVSCVCTRSCTLIRIASVPPSCMKADTCSWCGSGRRFCWSPRSPLLDNGEPTSPVPLEPLYSAAPFYSKEFHSPTARSWS